MVAKMLQLWKDLEITIGERNGKKVATMN